MQQAVILANVDPDLWHHMMSLGHNMLTNLNHMRPYGDEESF